MFNNKKFNDQLRCINEGLYHADKLTANPNVVHNNNLRPNPKAHVLLDVRSIFRVFDKSNNVYVQSMLEAELLGRVVESGPPKDNTL